MNTPTTAHWEPSQKFSTHTFLPAFLQESSISKANSFLGAKASAGLLGAHAAAITAYALTLTEAPEDDKNVAHNNLMAMVQETGSESLGS